MKSKCLLCTIAAYASIVAGIILMLVILPGWVYMILLSLALILGGVLWLKK